MRIVLASFVAFALAACGDGNSGSPDLGTPGGDLPALDDGIDCTPSDPYVEDVSACPFAPDDYQPRDAMSANDTWPACVTDDGFYTLFGASTPASAARTSAFEMMAAKLWANAAVPTPQDFVDARTAYSIAQGLGSRVERRQDIHYPEPEDPSIADPKFACSMMGVPERYPDRCAGPAKLLPIVNDAFQRGIGGERPRIQAGRLEAALLWFFYLSQLAELWTSSFDNAADCDSAWGYFNGAVQRNATPIGLGALVQAIAPETYDRNFDAILAGRCWRAIDPMLPTVRLDLYKRASNQTDRAALRGVAMIARERLRRMQCATGERKQAHFEFAKILVGFLDRESTARDAAKAAGLKAAVVDKTRAEDVAVPVAIAALDALYRCP
jgi:hypothetical protein